MIIGNAVKQKIKKRGMLKIIRNIFFRLSILNAIDFNEKKGILLFISKLEIIIITKKVVLDSIKLNVLKASQCWGLLMQLF